MNTTTYARKASVPSAAPPLKVGRPDDAFEREADRAADAVMSSAGTAAQWSLSRMSLTPPMQRKASGTAEMNHAPASVYDVLRSSGRPLDRAMRSFFEPRFGHDFGKVRIHTDAQAAESARAVGADAYTVGPHIVFSTGTYAHSDSQRLIAHELSHVVQQNGAQPLIRPDSPVNGTWARRGSEGMPLSRINSSAPLQRQTAGGSPDAPPAIDRDIQLSPHVIPMDAKAVPEQGACEKFPGGSTNCEVDEQTGAMTGKITHQIDETNPCTRPCVEAHENVHVQQLKTFCPAVRDCYRAADAGKRPVVDCLRMATTGTEKRECAAYQVSVPCMKKRLKTAKECQSKENKEYGTRKLASEKCFRDKNCNADKKPEGKQGAK